MLRNLALLIGAVLACVPMTAASEPFTVDVLLKREAIGQASIDPSGRWAVFERLSPLEQADSFEFDYLNRTLRSDVHMIDLAREGEARRLVPAATGGGRVLGAWSPSGRRLLIYQLRDRTWTPGIVDMTTGLVRWLDVTPELSGWGRSVQWRSDDELVMIVRTDGRLPFLLRASWELTVRLPQLWTASREGRAASRTELGSGRFRQRGLAPAAQSLVSVSASTGDVSVLDHGRYYDLELSPDGRRVAAATLSDLAPVIPDRPLRQSQGPRQRTLKVFDLITGQTSSPITGSDLLPNLLTWSQNSEELLVWVREPSAVWSDGSLMRIDVGSGRARSIPLEGLTPVMPETGLRQAVVLADWWKNEPILHAKTQDGRADWYRLLNTGPVRLTGSFGTVPTRVGAIYPFGLLLVADRAVWRVDPAGTATRLSPAAETVVAVRTGAPDEGQRLSYNNASRMGAVVVSTPSGVQRYAIDGAIPSETLIHGEPGDSRVLAIASAAALSLKTDTRYVQTLEVRQPGRGSRVGARINELNAGIQFARRRAIDHIGPAGERLTSWLYLPPQPSASLPPLVVLPYPGDVHDHPPSAAEPTSDSAMTSAQLLAGAGYAALVPSLPRGSYRGEPSKDMAEQMLSIVNVAARGGEFDPDRLGVWGHSFGAHAALAVATQTSQFCAIVASNGIYDLAGSWGRVINASQRVLPEDGASFASRGGWAETGQAAMGTPPWDDTARYIRNSPYFAADRITTPVLLITADFDYSSPDQSEAMFAALHRQGKDAVLLTYFGDGHVLESPGNIRDMVRKVLDWFEIHLSSSADSDPPSAPIPGADPGLDSCQDHHVTVSVLPDEIVAPEHPIHHGDVDQTSPG